MFDPINRNIRNTAFFFTAIFVILIFHISYIQILQADFLAGHDLNRRNVESVNRISRGEILDRSGKKITQSVKNISGDYRRTYEYGPLFAHVVGYASTQYGKAGLESSYNKELSGLGSVEHRMGPLSQLWKPPNAGNTILLTLDASLQQAAYNALNGYRGAIVVIAPHTGEVLAIVSSPSFDPNKVDELWPTISNREDSPLLNRAVQGLYPPGSVIKTMVAETALTEKVSTLKKSYFCEGSLKIGSDYILPEVNKKAHGKIYLEEALTVSCNVTFAKLALELGGGRINKMFDRYGFFKPLNSDLQEAANHIPDVSKLKDGEVAQLGIGQGPLLVTPLRMAMLAVSFANKGTMMKPYLVSKIFSPDGGLLKQIQPEIWLNTASPSNSEAVGHMMESVISEGTGVSARLKGVRIAGKTGTAENPHGLPHAWFIGFAPVDNPQIALAVVVENAGSGSSVAAPIARQIFFEALR